MMKKFATTICIGLLLTTLVGCKEEVATQEKEIVRPIRSFVVEAPEVLEKGFITGKARAAQSVDLSFRVSGTLIERPVQVGDVLAKGDLVAKIDPSDYKAEERRALGGLEQAQAALIRAEGDYRREMNIFTQDQGATSEAAVERKAEALSRAKANVRSAKGAYTSVANQLAYTSLKTPFAGKVVSTYVENFETVQAKQNIVRLLDNSRIKFDVDVPEQSISSVQYVKDVFVNFDAFPDVDFPASVSEIATEASSTTRTYRVTLIMEQSKDIEILAGMAGRAGFSLDNSADQKLQHLTIPNSAVFSPNLGEESFVWLINSENMTVSKKGVNVGRVSEFGTEIVKGLEPGDVVASAGVHFLTEGLQVRLLKSQVENN